MFYAIFIFVMDVCGKKSKGNYAKNDTALVMLFLFLTFHSIALKSPAVTVRVGTGDLGKWTNEWML